MRNPIIFIVSSALIILGGCGGPLILRVYFLNGGKSQWLSTFLQNAGWPITLITLIISYLYRRKSEGSEAKLVFMKLPMLVSAVFIGFLVGLGAFPYAIGENYLPVSTFTIINSIQVAFTALFAFLILKQKFTIFSIASVIFSVAGGACLAWGAGGGGKSAGETSSQYTLGFLMAILTTAITGLSNPLLELVYMKTKGEMIFTLVMEMQMMISFSATIVATIGMLISHSFQNIPLEARSFKLGEAKYYMVITGSGIFFESASLGVVGVVLSASALFEGIIIAFVVPLTELLAVFLLHESFTIGKGVSLVLCLLGIGSYYYGEIKQSKKSNIPTENEEASQPLIHDNNWKRCEEVPGCHRTVEYERFEKPRDRTANTATILVHIK